MPDAPTVGLQGAGAGRGEDGAQVVGPVGDVLETVRVRGRGERHAARHEVVQQPGRRILLARRLAPARRGHLGRHARGRRRLGEAVPPLGGRVRHVARDLDEVGVRQHVARARRGQLLHGTGIGLPAGVDLTRRPLRRRGRVVEVVEAPGADPVHGPEQDVEGIAGEQTGHRVHPALVEVDLETDDDRQPCLLGLERARHVGVEVGSGVELPVARHGLGQRGRRTRVVPETAQQCVGLSEPKKVLGDRQLGDPGRLGALAVRGQLVQAQRRLVLRVRP